MTDPTGSSPGPAPVRLAYLVSHPIQYQAPLLARIAREPGIDLTVLFGSDFSVRGYRDEGFGVEVAWDTPLLDGYRSEFLRPWRDTGTVTSTSPISRGVYQRLRGNGAQPAFDALWVHGYASVNALQGIVAAHALGIPVLLRAEGWLGDRERSPLKQLAKAGFFHLLRESVTAVLPIGTANSVYWRHCFGDDMPRFPMPYAVDNAWFARRARSAADSRHELRAELALEPGRPVILFASKLQTRKNTADLVTAYRLLVNDCVPGRAPYLVIVGDGEERAALEAQVKTLSLKDVRFAGFRNQTELPRFFELADVFVLPSRHEPWGLIVNEAMSTGCPVIVSSDVGSHLDLVQDGTNGCVFPVGDVPALAQTLRRIFATPETAATMGRAAQERMRTWSFEQDVEGLRGALAFATRRIRA